jgi:hypothetical protein
MHRIYLTLLAILSMAVGQANALTARNEQYYAGLSPKQILAYFVETPKLGELIRFVDNPTGEAATASMTLERAEIQLVPNGKYFVRFTLPGGYSGEQSGSVIGFSDKNSSIGLRLDWTGKHFDSSGNIVVENKSEITILIYEDPHRTGSFVRIDSEGLKNPASLAALNEGWTRIYLLPIYSIQHSQAKNRK